MPYPFEADLDYVRNAWYVAGWSDDFGEGIAQRWYLGESVVIWRDSAGVPVALADRCPHRHYPLSRSRRVGDTIECGYHGFTFDRTGTCVRIPTQEHIPPGGERVRRYPLAERWEFVWIWLGDPALADESLLPDHAALGLTDPRFLPARGGTIEVGARYQLITENLLDLSHLNYLHPGVLGTEGVTMTPVTMSAGPDDIVQSTRGIRSDAAPPMYRQAFRLPEDALIDRDLTSIFYPPSLHVTHVRVSRPGSGGRYGQDGYHGEFKVVHALTPATSTSTHYFWEVGRTFQKDAATTEGIVKGIATAFRQDKEALEAQEQVVERLAEPVRELSCQADEASLRARRIVAARMRAERENLATADRARRVLPV